MKHGTSSLTLKLAKFLAESTFPIFFLLLTAPSCKFNEPQNRLKIDDGELVVGASANKVDGVFRSITILPGASSGSGCSGTAVSSTTAITAAHCVFKPGESVGANGEITGKKYCVSNSLYKNVCSSEIYVNPNVRDTKEFDGGHDSAYVVFPEGTFKTYFRMNSGDVKTGDSILLVGYSEHHLEDMSKGSKRFGYNEVSQLIASDQLDIVSAYGSSFESVGVSPGDSGGPMFKDCRVTGVASRMTQDGPGKENLHTNLTHPVTVAFLKASKTGYFCGISGDNEKNCPKAQAFGPKPGVTIASREFPCMVNAPITPEPIPPPKPDDAFKIFAALDDSDDLRIRGTSEISSASICVGITAEEAKSCKQRIPASIDGLNQKVRLTMPSSGSEYFAKVSAVRSSDNKSFDLNIKLKRK